MGCCRSRPFCCVGRCGRSSLCANWKESSAFGRPPIERDQMPPRQARSGIGPESRGGKRTFLAQSRSSWNSRSDHSQSAYSSQSGLPRSSQWINARSRRIQSSRTGMRCSTRDGETGEKNRESSTPGYYRVVFPPRSQSRTMFSVWPALITIGLSNLRRLRRHPASCDRFVCPVRRREPNALLRPVAPSGFR